jgi:hypothetical protein
MCLDHIIAHETYHFFHALPLKLAPTCFIKQCGTSGTQEFEYTRRSELQIMLQWTTQGTCHMQITLNMYKLNSSCFICKIICEKICKPHL